MNLPKQACNPLTNKVLNALVEHLHQVNFIDMNKLEVLFKMLNILCTAVTYGHYWDRKDVDIESFIETLIKLLKVGNENNMHSENDQEKNVASKQK